MKKLAIIFGLLVGINQTGSSACSSGGPGALSCTTTVTVGPVTVSHSVSCGSGTYACCTAIGAHCKPVEGGGGNSQ